MQIPSYNLFVGNTRPMAQRLADGAVLINAIPDSDPNCLTP